MVLCLFLFCLVFCFVCLFCLCFSVGIVTANRTLYWSYLSSLLKSTIVKMDDVFALINRICQYATGLQAWWTTWRELWGVGRKKALYHPWYHSQDWNGGQTRQNNAVWWRLGLNWRRLTLLHKVRSLKISSKTFSADQWSQQPLLASAPHPGLRYHVQTRERPGSSFSQLGLEPYHTGLTAQSLFFLEESCRVKRNDTQRSQTSQTTSKEFSSFKNVLLDSHNKTSSTQTHKITYKTSTK